MPTIGLNCPGFDEAFAAFLKGAQKHSDDWYDKNFPSNSRPTMIYEIGPKYVRVVKWEPDRNAPTDQKKGGHSVYCFIDRTNGNMLKGSWKAPVKNGVRGNILQPGHALDKCNWHGPIYLRR